MATLAALPTPRNLITTLINSLPSSPDAARTSESNPLKSIPASSRHILTTLHVLLPDILLKSLDLLDRNLVTRIVLTQPQAPDATEASSRSSNSEAQDDLPQSTENPTHSRQTAVHSSEGDQLNSKSTTKSSNPSSAGFYLVKSSQEPRSRFRNAESSTTNSGISHVGKAYIVRTQAWNCNCEAFAFSAFPSSLSAAATSSWKQQRDGTAGNHYGMKTTASEAEEWEFGGMSRNGRDGAAVPCCKHLLACVLAERWVGVFGSYVLERGVGREAIAGLVADG